ncbi:MAG: guanylate kinase [Myxococcota bacterium]|jgi:guanylate kinase|nr:guanylate kinase [Myxococcota bacterium]
MEPQSVLLILAAPSGAGKSTLCKRLLAREPELSLSCSLTTRPPRPGEVHGREYYFVDDETFDRTIAEGGFLEWFPVHKHRYGTARFVVEEALAAGRSLVFDVDVEGAAAIRRAYPRAVAVFILPPSLDALAARLRGRGSDDEATIQLRLSRTRRELAQAASFDYLLVNDDLAQASDALHAIYRAQRWAAWRQAAHLAALQGD